jgi:TonB family protein
MHRRPTVLPVLLVIGLFLAACSKKEEPKNTGAAPDAPAAAAPDSSAVAAAPEVPAQEASPGSTRSDTSVSAPAGEPAIAPAASPLPPETAPSGGTKDDVREAEFRVFFPAFYPLSMRMEGREGRVNLNLEINPAGDVVDVVVASATAPEFTAFAVEAARKWKFIPARVNGVPITSRRIFPYEFVSEFGTRGMPARSPLARLAYVDGVYYSIDAKGQYSLANINDPIPLLQTTPVITPQMAAAGEVSISLSFTVTEEGQVVNPRVVEGTNQEFGEASVAAIVGWQFIPRIRNGKAVQSQVKLPLRLNIPAAPAEKPN